jgi:hypothetical protein
VRKRRVRTKRRSRGNLKDVEVQISPENYQSKFNRVRSLGSLGKGNLMASAAKLARKRTTKAQKF